MRCCVYVATLLALVSCKPNQSPSFRNRHKNTYLQKKLNVFNPQQNLQISVKNGKHKIIGGEFVMDIEEYPFMALLLRVDELGTKFKCGATILNKKYLLSAAHCFQESEPNSVRHPANQYIAYVGGLSMERSLDNATVKQYFIHPENKQYVYEDVFILNFDIAVIELVKELKFSRKIFSVILPPPLITSGLTSRLPKRCIVLGTGKTSLHFFIYKPEFTISLLKVAKVEIVNPNNTIYSDCKEITKICSIDVTHNKNTVASGDSGGPLICDGVQVGIMSYTSKNFIPNIRTVNTRVEYFVGWINTFIKEN